MMIGVIWQCSRKETLVRTGFPPSGALGLRSIEYTQISACVRAPTPSDDVLSNEPVEENP